MVLARLASLASGRREPMHSHEIRRLVAAKGDDPVLVQILQGLGFAKPLQIIRRGIDVKMHGEEATLNQVRLGGAAQADGHVGFPHGQVQFLVGQDQFDPYVRIEIQELGYALSEPDRAKADGRRDLQLA
jgi:hypothetical protein